MPETSTAITETLIDLQQHKKTVHIDPAKLLYCDIEPCRSKPDRTSYTRSATLKASADISIVYAQHSDAVELPETQESKTSRLGRSD